MEEVREIVLKLFRGLLADYEQVFVSWMSALLNNNEIRLEKAGDKLPTFGSTISSCSDGMYLSICSIPPLDLPCY